MKTKLFALLTYTVLALPAGATPVAVVNPNERMVTVPGLEQLGPSRISTVQHCAEIEGIANWRELTTDSDFENMQSCLAEHT
jgi:hypothetical protein